MSVSACYKPRVVVIGAGAMGGLFGGLLAEGGLPVTLVDTWAEHIAAIRAHGLRVVGVGGERQIAVDALTDASEIAEADVVLFQCKAYANEAAARSVAHLFTPDRHTVAISFQNGLGNEQLLGSVLGMEHVVAGLTAQGGLVEAPGVVRNYGDLPTCIGEPDGGTSERSQRIAGAFSAHGLRTEASDDIKREKWRKLLGNIGLGAISALTDMRSVEIMALPELRETVFRLVDEAARVAGADGVSLDVDEARSVLMQLASTDAGGTGDARSSMREDLVRARPTEIDFIHGAVARLAHQYGVATPTLDAMVALVKGVERKVLEDAPR